MDAEQRIADMSGDEAKTVLGISLRKNLTRHCKETKCNARCTRELWDKCKNDMLDEMIEEGLRYGLI